MSLLTRDTRQCAVCSTTTTQTVVTLRPILESYDLDGRPYEASLLALPYWVQCCGGCKYCARDIRQAGDNLAAICKTAAYLAILNDASFPYMARQYRAAAHIATLYHNHAEAGWHSIRATWKCEDMQHPLARICRNDTLTHYVNAYQQGQRFGQHNAEECLIIADLYRRNSDMHHANEYAERALQGSSNDATYLQAIHHLQALIRTSTTTRQPRPLH
ncbi:MAG: hypothetical protein ACK46D_18185 [Roseiflexaceae bacterium]|jgi:hypothetical protein